MPTWMHNRVARPPSAQRLQLLIAGPVRPPVRAAGRRRVGRGSGALCSRRSDGRSGHGDSAGTCRKTTPPELPPRPATGVMPDSRHRWAILGLKAAIYIRRRVGRIRRSPCDGGGRGASQAQRALVEELGKELRGQALVGMFRWGTIYKPSRRKLPTFYEVHRSSAPGGRVRAMHQQQRANRGQPTTFYYRGT
jgi:hypothetical protein